MKQLPRVPRVLWEYDVSRVQHANSPARACVRANQTNVINSNTEVKWGKYRVRCWVPQSDIFEISDWCSNEVKTGFQRVRVRCILLVTLRVENWNSNWVSDARNIIIVSVATRSCLEESIMSPLFRSSTSYMLTRIGIRWFNIQVNGTWTSGPNKKGMVHNSSASYGGAKRLNMYRKWNEPRHGMNMKLQVAEGAGAEEGEERRGKLLANANGKSIGSAETEVKCCGKTNRRPRQSSNQHFSSIAATHSTLILLLSN